MQIKDISVGIPTYNEAGNIKRLLMELLSQNRSGFRLANITVVDDCSTDQTIEEIKSVKSSEVILFRNSKRRGQAFSQNRILEANTADLLVLLNADTLPANPEFLRNMVSAARKAPARTAIVGAGVDPVMPETGFEKLMVNAYKLRSRMASRWNGGDNIYTAIGAARAFSQEFAENFRFPPVVAEDVYCYLEAKRNHYHYIYHPAAKVRLKMPENWNDHFKQSKRFTNSIREMKRYFPADYVEENFRFPLLIQIKQTWDELTSQPFITIAYLLVIIATRLYPNSTNSLLWNEVTTSKRVYKPTTDNVLIPNATGPANLGDQAILAPTIELIRQVRPEAKLAIHSNFPELYTEKPGDSLSHTLYSYAVFDKPDFLSRLSRTSIVIFDYLLWKSGIRNLTESPIGRILGDYARANLIVLAGGGYLRSNPGLTQTLNAIFILLMIDFAAMTKARKIMAPVSFGPYSDKRLEEFAVSILRKLDTVAVREKISYRKLQQYKLKNLILSTDLALFIPDRKIRKYRQETIGFTIRPWLAGAAQIHFNDIYAKALAKFALRYKLRILPIIQVSAPGYAKDEDTEITGRLAKELKKLGCSVMKPVRPGSLDEAIETYGKLNLLLGMRMHSNIIAATQGVPFAAVAYEHKTEGIAESLGFRDYVMPIEKVNEKSLYETLNRLYQNRAKEMRRLMHNLDKLITKERKEWEEILHA